MGRFGSPSHPNNSAPFPYAPPYPAAATTPSAAHSGPAIPRSGPMSFAVYFATGSDRLNAAAHSVIAQIAAAEAHMNAQIAVAGFTDTVGDSASNFDLSRRRAENVRAALLAAGVPDHLVALVWHGEDGLQVPTGDGVHQAQNRRVVIVLGAPPPPVS
jgi:outer membrane protein OmpA-like peptidoglycan-associated protein